MRRHSLGFEYPPSASDSAAGGGSECGSHCGLNNDDCSEEADCDSAFVDDDLESSWDQLRMRQFKEQLSMVEEAPARAGGTSLFIRLMKKLMMVNTALFANGWLDKYEKIILVLAVLLIADTLALTYLLATYPVYRDLLSRLGYQMLFNSTGFFYKASPLRDL